MVLGSLLRSLAEAAEWLRQGRHAAAVTICLVALLLSVATPYSYFMNPERGLYVIFLVVILFTALFSVLGSAEHELEKFGIEEAVMGQTPLLGHKGGISSVDVSSGSRQRIVSGSYDGTVRTWSLLTGAQELVYRGHAGAVFALAVSKAGFVVSGGMDRTIQVWDINTGERIKTLSGHTASVLSLRVLEPTYACCEEAIVLSGGSDGVVRLWSVGTGAEIRALVVPPQEEERHGGRVVSMSTVAVSAGPDPMVVAGSSAGLIFVWSLRTGDFLCCLEGHFGAVHCVAVSPSVRRPLVVSASVDWTVRVWDLRAGVHVSTLEGHSGAVGSVTICGGADDGDTSALRGLPTDGDVVGGTNSMHLIVSGGRDSTVRVWDLFTGQLYITLEDHSDSVCAVALSLSPFPPWGYQRYEPPGIGRSTSAKDLRLSAEGRLRPVASNDRCASLADPPPPAPRLTHSSSGKKMGALIITGGVEASLKVWDLEKIKRDLKWNKRRSWAVMVSLCRNGSADVSQPTGGDENAEPTPDLLAATTRPGFRRFIGIDALCGEVATYL